MTAPAFGFWDTFVAEHWERRPSVFRGLLREPLITPPQAFGGVMSASERWRRDGSAMIRFCIEDAVLQSRVTKYLPREDDRTFGAYARRIEPLLGGRKFGLIVNGFTTYDFELFNRVRRFLDGLYARVGLPGEFCDLDVFIGNYLRTPFGIHTDTGSNFSFVFEGRKRVLVWPFEVLASRREVHRAVDYEDVRSEAIVLEGGPGDVIYWPSSYWHIAESDGELSGVMNVSLYVGDQSQRFVAEATAPPIRRSSETMLPWDPVFASGRLPEALVLDEPKLPADEARRAVLRAWLKRITSYNFFRSTPPPLSPTPLAASARVRADVEFPLITAEDSGYLLCSAHGHVLELSAAPKLAAMIARLGTGETCAVDELVASTIGPAEVNGATLEVRPAEVDAVLQNLLAMRVIREVL
jgi:hypothetical protein